MTRKLNKLTTSGSRQKQVQFLLLTPFSGGNCSRWEGTGRTPAGLKDPPPNVPQPPGFLEMPPPIPPPPMIPLPVPGFPTPLPPPTLLIPCFLEGRPPPPPGPPTPPPPDEVWCPPFVPLDGPPLSFVPPPWASSLARVGSIQSSFPYSGRFSHFIRSGHAKPYCLKK